MMRAISTAVLIAAAGTAVAEIDAVRVIGERSFLTECVRLGDVQGSSLMGLIVETEGWRNAVEEMKEKALALGATHLLLQRVEGGITGSRGYGEAYGCPAESEAPAQRSRRRR
jgi:hypothetical protein